MCLPPLVSSDAEGNDRTSGRVLVLIRLGLIRKQ